MKPTQPSRTERPIPNSSPYHPSLNGAEYAQRTFPSPIPRSSTLSILRRIPTHPQPSLVAEAGSTTTDMGIEVDTTPGGFLAEIDQYADQRFSPVMTPGHGLRHLRQPCQSKYEHLEKAFFEGIEKEMDKEKEKEKEAARAQELHRQRQQRRARKHTSRRTQPFNAEALANNLSTFSMDDPEQQQRDPREVCSQCTRRWGRGFRARYRCKVREQGLARQMRELERRVQGGGEGVGMDVDGGEGNWNMVTEVQRTDTNSVHGAFTGDGDVPMSSTESTSLPQSKED